MKFLSQPPGLFREQVPSWPIDEEREQFESELLGESGFPAGSVAAVLQQMMMEIDLHGAGLCASATQRAGIREMFPILQPAQVRRDDRADRARVGRAIGVPTNIAKARGDVGKASCRERV